MSDFKPVRAWRVYYGPNDWICSGGGLAPADLEDGILVVVAYETEDYEPGKPYRRILSGADWYWWDGDYVGSLADFARPQTIGYPPGRWLSPQPIYDAFPNAIAKKGVWIEDGVYEQTYALARKAHSPP